MKTFTSLHRFLFILLYFYIKMDPSTSSTIVEGILTLKLETTDLLPLSSHMKTFIS